MTKLHEILAVDGDLQEAAKKIQAETINTFTKKVEHFVGMSKTLHMFDEGRRQEEAGLAELKLQNLRQ